MFLGVSYNKNKGMGGFRRLCLCLSCHSFLEKKAKEKKEKVNPKSFFVGKTRFQTQVQIKT